MDIKGTTGSNTDATLSNLELEDGAGTAIALTPIVASGVFEYDASVLNTVSRITVTPTPP